MKIVIMLIGVLFSMLYSASKLYVVNSVDRNISVIDTATHTVIKKVPASTPLIVGAPLPPVYETTDIAISSDGSKVFTVTREDNLTVIDTQTDTVMNSYWMAAPAAYAVALTPDGSKAFVLHDFIQGMHYVDLQTGVISPVVSLATSGPIFPGTPPPNPEVAITPNGVKGYYLNHTYSQVVEFNLTNSISAPAIPIPTTPIDMVISPDSSKVYIIGDTPPSLHVMDTASNQFIGTPIQLSPNPRAMIITSDGSKLFITHDLIASGTMVDTASLLTPSPVVVPFPIPVNLAHNLPAITLNGDDSIAYIVDQNGSLVVGVDTTTFAPTVPPIYVGNSPSGIVFKPDNINAFFPAVYYLLFN